MRERSCQRGKCRSGSSAIAGRPAGAGVVACSGGAVRNRVRCDRCGARRWPCAGRPARDFCRGHGERARRCGLCGDACPARLERASDRLGAAGFRRTGDGRDLCARPCRTWSFPGSLDPRAGARWAIRVAGRRGGGAMSAARRRADRAVGQSQDARSRGHTKTGAGRGALERAAVHDARGRHANAQRRRIAMEHSIRALPSLSGGCAGASLLCR